MALLTESQQKEARKVLVWSFVTATVIVTLFVGGCVALIAAGSASVERAEKEIHPSDAVFHPSISGTLDVRLIRSSRQDEVAQEFAESNDLTNAESDYLSLTVEVRNGGNKPAVNYTSGPVVRTSTAQEFQPIGQRRENRQSMLNPGASCTTDYYYVLPKGSLTNPVTANLDAYFAFWVSVP